jgi:FKBP-type peptidyl-prolyl cis-trans isomerase FkpA
MPLLPRAKRSNFFQFSRSFHFFYLSYFMTPFIRPRSALGALAALAVAAAAPAFAAAPVTTASGLIYESLKDGSGPSPKASDTVRVHYRGTFAESGKEFDSSIARGQPIEFPLTGVIPCWTEGVQKMKVGGKAKLICPPAIAYGARGAGGVIPPNATLNFEVELLGIK